MSEEKLCSSFIGADLVSAGDAQCHPSSDGLDTPSTMLKARSFPSVASSRGASVKPRNLAMYETGRESRTKPSPGAPSLLRRILRGGHPVTYQPDSSCSHHSVDSRLTTVCQPPTLNFYDTHHSFPRRTPRGHGDGQARLGWHVYESRVSSILLYPTVGVEVSTPFMAHAVSAY